MSLLRILTGAVLFAYLGIVARASWVLSHPRRDFVPRDYRPSALPLERFWLQSRGGLRLAAWYTGRDDAPGTIIFAHGVWSNHLEMESRAEALWRRGFSVLLFDCRACGESEGRTTTLGQKEVDDLLGAIDFLAGDSDPGPIGVWGNSMGGSVAIMAAARCHHIDAVVSDSAFAVLADNLRHGFHAATGLPAWLFLRAVIALAEALAGANLPSVRPIDSVPDLSPRPLLLVQGEQDVLVHPREARALHAAAGEPKELWMLPDCGHVEAFDRLPEEFTDRVDKFFRQAFESAGPTRADTWETP